MSVTSWLTDGSEMRKATKEDISSQNTSKFHSQTSISAILLLRILFKTIHKRKPLLRTVSPVFSWRQGLLELSSMVQPHMCGSFSWRQRLLEVNSNVQPYMCGSTQLVLPSCNVQDSWAGSRYVKVHHSLFQESSCVHFPVSAWVCNQLYLFRPTHHLNYL